MAQSETINQKCKDLERKSVSKNALMKQFSKDLGCFQFDISFPLNKHNDLAKIVSTSYLTKTM